MNGLGNHADVWLVAVRAIHFAASAVMAGALVFRMVVVDPALRAGRPTADIFDPQTLGVAWIGLAVAVVSGVAWIALQASAMSGLSFGEAMTTEVIVTVVTQTQFGLVSEIRLALAMLLAACLAYDRLPGMRWLALVLALGLVASIAWTGHAGSTMGETGILHLTADTLHLVAAASWIGGLVSLALLLAMVSRHQAEGWSSLVCDAVQRFSTLGIVSVTTLLIAGMVNTGILVGSPHALLGTDYGRLLMVKIALFAVMLGFAAVNRFRLTPRLADFPGSEREREALRRLTRNCTIEIALGLLIFAIVGALGTIHPANHPG